MANPLAELLVSIVGDVSDVRSAFDEVGQSASALGQSMTGIGTSMQNTGKSMSMYVTAPLLAVGAGAFKMSMDFDDSMRQVQAVTGTTGESLQQLTDYALQLGADTAFSSSQAAEAMFELGQAGFTVDEIMTSTDDVLALASASSLDLGTSAEIASNVINGFGLEVSDTAEVVDILAQASSSTNADVTGLGEALSYAAPTASALGYSLEETTAMIGVLADSAITGSRAGTTLNGAMSALISPSSEAAAALGKYGISLEQVNPETNKFTDVLGLLGTAGVSATDIITIFGREAGPGVTALLNTGIGSINELTTSLENSDGAAQQMADTMEGGVGGAWRAFTGSVETLSIKLGDLVANAISPFIARATELVNTISNLPGPVLQTGVAILGLAAAAGPTLIAFGTLIRSAGTVLSLFGGFPMLLGPVGIALAGVAAAAALIYTNWDRVGPWLSQQFTNIRAAVDPLIERVRNLVTNGFGYISNWWSMNGQAVMNSIMAAFQRVIAFIEPVYTSVRNLVINAFQLISNWWSANGSTVLATLSGAFDRVMSSVIPLITTVRNFVSTALQQISNWWSMNGNAVMTGLSNAFQYLINYITPVIAAIVNFVNTGLRAISNWWATNGNRVMDLIWQGIQYLGQVVPPVAEAVRTFVTTGLQQISTWWNGSGSGAFINFVTSLRNVWTAISPLIPLVVSFVSSLNQLSGWWSTNGPAIMQAAQNLGNTVSWVFNNLFVPAIKIAMAILPPLVSVVQTGFSHIGDYIMLCVNTVNWFADVWRSIQPIISGVINAIVSAVTGLYNSVTSSMNGLQSNWSGVWNAMLNTGRTVITAIYNTVVSIINSIINFVVGGIARLTSSWSSGWNGILGTSRTILNSILSIVTGVLNSIISTATSGISRLTSSWSGGWNGILSTSRSILNSILSTVTSILNSILSAFTSIISRISGTWSSGLGGLSGIASSAMRAVASAISGSGSSLASAATSAGSAAVSALQTQLAKVQYTAAQIKAAAASGTLIAGSRSTGGSSSSSGSTGITRQGSDGTGESGVRIREAHATGGVAGYTGWHWMEEKELAVPEQFDWDGVLTASLSKAVQSVASSKGSTVSHSYGGDTNTITIYATMTPEYDFDKLMDDVDKRLSMNASRTRFRKGITT